MIFSLIKNLFSKRKINVHCLGDSHAEVLKVIARNESFSQVEFKFCLVRGASNMGLANPRSKTNAGKIFREYLEKEVEANDYVIFCLGEVDCGFVIWYRAEKLSIPVQNQFEESLKNYLRLIELALSKQANPIVMSVPLPTIQDDQDWGEVAHARREVVTSLQERTNLTKSYNLELMQFCEDRDAIYLNLERRTIDADTGLVDSAFLNENPLDHHLDPKKLVEIIVSELKNVCDFDIRK